MAGIIDSITNMRSNAKTMKRKHFSAAARLERMSYFFGITVAVMTVFLGSNSLSPLLPDDWNKVVGGFLGFGSALLVSLQTFLKPRETAAAHRNVGNKYTALYGKCDHMEKKIEDGLIDLASANVEFEKLQEEYNAVNIEAEALPTSDKDFTYAESWKAARPA